MLFCYQRLFVFAKTNWNARLAIWVECEISRVGKGVAGHAIVLNFIYHTTRMRRIESLNICGFLSISPLLWTETIIQCLHLYMNLTQLRYIWKEIGQHFSSWNLTKTNRIFFLFFHRVVVHTLHISCLLCMLVNKPMDWSAIYFRPEPFFPRDSAALNIFRK